MHTQYYSTVSHKCSELLIISKLISCQRFTFKNPILHNLLLIYHYVGKRRQLLVIDYFVPWGRLYALYTLSHFTITKPL